MDPVMELATVVVSYLWSWRDADSTLTVVPKAEEVNAGTLAHNLAYTLRNDHAMLQRLLELTQRAPTEAWVAKSETALIAADFEDVLKDVASRDAKGILATIGARAREFQKYEPAPEISLKVCLKMVESYAVHAKRLARYFADTPLRAESSRLPITREGLTTDIAQRLMKDRIASKVAAAIDYCPMLLRDMSLRTAALDDENYPFILLAHCKERDIPIPFPLVLEQELREVDESRKLRFQDMSRSKPCRSDERATAGGDDKLEDANDTALPDDDDTEPNDGSRPHRFRLVTDRAFDMDLLGLCLSGGGIRSATFNLGVVQGLANRGWLARFDYLSTVSGGGYIGSWLIAWIKRLGSIASVDESLRGLTARAALHRVNPHQNVDPSDAHVRPIRFLREYSNYLAPRPGFFTTDSWTMVSIWIRNTALNLLVLALALMAILIAPRLTGYLLLRLTSPALTGTAAIAFFLAASVLIGHNLRSFGTTHRLLSGIGPARGDHTLAIAMTVVLPLFVAAFFATAALWVFPPLDLASAPSVMALESASFGGRLWSSVTNPVFYLSALTCLATLGLTAVIGNFRTRDLRDLRLSDEEFLSRLLRVLWLNARAVLFSALTAALAGGAGGLLLSQHVVPILWEDTQRGVWIAVALGPLTVLLALSASIVVYIGLEGTRFPDERREWWSRLGALIALAGIAWALVSCISFFAPLWVARLGLYASAAGVSWGTLTAVGAWLGSTGKSNGSNLPLDRNIVTSTLIRVAPFVFVLGFLIILSITAHALLGVLQQMGVLAGPDFTAFDLPPFDLSRHVETYWALLEPRSFRAPIVALALCAAAGVLAWRVDVNEFSMHHFYRNRLVRAYLGASRSARHRWPNAFTGFDMDDDIKLSRFVTRDRSRRNDALSDCRPSFQGPYLIVNAALNTSTGDDLAWQERQARSFTFTPLYCGYDFAAKQPSLSRQVLSQYAYRPTDRFGSRGPDRGVDLGTAMAISGAAANPNAGYHTSPAVAFLLTVFNARLGWWIGNPRARAWMKSTPTFGLFYLLSELLGFADTQRKYINLSDGGHFDNMGLYELVRRRCRYIVVCDAEQDPTHSMQGLANAIRRCRVDFGVMIAFRRGAIQRLKPDKETKRSEAHFIVGRILYPGIRRPGRLLYIKSSMAGNDEPTDVLEYRERFAEFPHELTSDQFFDESQFESYRALGQHIAEKLPRFEWTDLADRDRLDELFRNCRERSMPRPKTEGRNDTDADPH